MATGVSISDLRLKVLAEEPASDLFPILNAGPAFSPWFVLLAFLPCLPGVLAWTLDERSAVGGLQALDIAQHAAPESAPVNSVGMDASIHPVGPGLATWLTAMTLSLKSMPMPWGLLLVSYLSVAATILAAARLGRRFGIDRLASLTALCCVGCPVLLNSAHLATPGALGLCCLTVALERFLAHLDTSIRAWSGRLLTAGLAWGGSWLALGWPAATLGAALLIHAILFSPRNADRGSLSELSRQSFLRKYRRSFLVFAIIGLLTGCWHLGRQIQDHGLAASAAWLFDPTPHAASPLYPDSAKIAAWGGVAGLAFWWGWIVLGAVTMITGRPQLSARIADGRGVLLASWWVSLIVCRVVVAASGGDPTLWDILQTIPASLTAAIGMETVIERRVGPAWLALAIAVGVGSLAVFVPMVDTLAMRSAFGIGAVICLGPVARNLWVARSWRWSESLRQRALRGLILGTWAAGLTWAVWQTVPQSRVDAEIERKLDRVRTELPSPAAVIVVSQDAPRHALMFQLRRHWPDAILVAADDRWDEAISQTLSQVDDWADAQFLVVELTHRDSQFRRPAAGWIVRPVGDPRRYYESQLTVHRVSIQSP
jgi:hypothetical protein